MTQLIVPTSTSVDTLDADASVDRLDASLVVPPATRRGGAAPSELCGESGVPAVLVEREDGTCVVYHGGQRGEWPSTDLAFGALRREAPGLVWRETTARVWIGRPDRNDPPIVDRGSRPLRRVDGSPAAKPPPTGDSYLTARVIRGLSVAS